MCPRIDAPKNRPSRALLALALFGISFGFVEASVVVYLRDAFEPLVLALDDQRTPDDVFPLITLEQLRAAEPHHLRRLEIEVLREAATMVLLVSIGLAIGWSFNTWFAAFIVAFGVWDVFYYVFLRLLIDWPSSLLDWDILFLIPCPWVGPVLAPVLVAMSMIAAGGYLLWHDARADPIRIGWRHWLFIVLGGLIIIVSFCWNYRDVMAGGIPETFPWPMFIVGETIGLAGFLVAVAQQRMSGEAGD